MRGAIFDLIGYFAGNVPFEFMILSFFSIFVVIFLCVPIHECAHAATAYWLGDDTASSLGRLTVNPVAHIDPVGAASMIVCGFGWGKPVPVRLYRCRKVSARTANVLTSVAGPLSNFVLALLFVIIYKIMAVTAASTETMAYIVYGLYLVARINTGLMVFNLIPVPPLDGYALLEPVLPQKYAVWVEHHTQMLRFIFLTLILSGVLRVPLGYAADGVMWVLDKMTFFIH